MIRWAIEHFRDENGDPTGFTAADIIDMLKTKYKNFPSVREVGMVLGSMKRTGEVIYLGEEGALQSRRLLEQAGLTQMGVRKVALYIKDDEWDDGTDGE
jgi:hypothetical protein